MEGPPASPREEFLIAYYGILWANINRHITGTWQTVTTLGISVALLGLVGKSSISMGISVTLIVGICAWYSATVHNSALWFARNQAIATNVERLFLDAPGDLRLVQPYFASHRTGLLISHFQIPLWLSRGLAGTAALLYARSGPVADGMPDHMPYLACGLYVFVEAICFFHARRSYQALLSDAPGLTVSLDADATSVPTP